MADPDDVAEPYARIASHWVTRVRDEGPEDVRRWWLSALRSVTPGEPDLLPAAFNVGQMLAAAVPDDIEWSALTEWTQRRDGWDLKPHGTMAALRRHQYHRERPCALCRAYEAGFKAGRYAKGKEAA